MPVEIRKKALVYVEDGMSYRIADALKVKRILDRGHEDLKVHIVARMRLAGRTGHVYVDPQEVQNRRRLAEALTNRGYLWPKNAKHAAMLFDYIQDQLKSAEVVRLTGTSGWYQTANDDWQYEFPVFDGVDGTKGSLESWNREIARRIRGNPYLICMTCAALGAILMRHHPTIEISPTMALIGSPASGKSTCASVARSVMSPPQARRSWNGTTNGLHDFVRRTSDALVDIDELGEGDTMVKLDLVYAIANRSPRLRHGDHAGLAGDAFHYGVVATSGESSLAELAAARRAKYPEGFEGRLICLPVDDEHLIVQQVNGEANAAALIDRLRAASNENYGIVGHEFATMVTESLAAKPVPGKKRFDQYLEQFLANAAGDARDITQLDRVAKQFALFATAGEMAIQRDLLKLEVGAALEACEWSFRAWLDHRRATGRAPRDAVARVSRWLAGARKDGRVKVFTKEAFEDPKLVAYLHKTRSGEKQILVKPTAFECQFGTRVGAHLDALDELGYHVRGPAGRRGKQVQIPESRLTPTFIVLRYGVLKAYPA